MKYRGPINILYILSKIVDTFADFTHKTQKHHHPLQSNFPHNQAP